MSKQEIDCIYLQGFLDKCAHAGLTTEQAHYLIKESKFNMPKPRPKVKPPTTVPGTTPTTVPGTTAPATGSNWEWLKNNKLNTAMTALPLGMYAYNYMTGGGAPADGTQQQPMGPQQPQRNYGQAGINVRGLGGLTPFLT